MGFNHLCKKKFFWCSSLWRFIYLCRNNQEPLVHFALLKQHVTTLTLGLWPKQGDERLRAKRKTWECKECEGMNPHTHKWTPMLGVGVPNGLLNLQSVIAGVKTHCLEEIFISLKIYWNLDVWNGLASPI